MDVYWYLLDDFDLVVGGVLCWQQGECVVGVYVEVVDGVVVVYVVVVEVGVDFYWLVDMYMFELGFFEVGVDLDLVQWDYGYQCIVWLYVLVDLYVVFGDVVGDWCDDG